MFTKPARLFRVLAIAEAITWTLLIAALIARAVGAPSIVVTIAGGIHGFVFLSYGATAILVGICAGTGLALYFGPLSVAIGRRALLEWVHVIAGILLPVPFLVGWCSRRFRLDVRRLNRFVPEDWEWLRSRDRRSGRIPVGKFNAGQKLNAAFTLSNIIGLLRWAP